MSSLCTGVDMCKKDCMNEIWHIAVQIVKYIIQESKHKLEVNSNIYEYMNRNKLTWREIYRWKGENMLVCVFVFPMHSELISWDGEAVTTVC